MSKKNFFFLKPCRGERGLALIIVILVIMVLTILGSIGYDLFIQRGKRVVAVKEESEWLGFTEAGIDDVRLRMTPTKDLEATITALSIGSSTTVSGGMTGDEASVVITKLGAYTYKLLSAYPSAGTPLRNVEVVVTADWASVFNHAACGCSSLEVRGTTDSYDSDDGVYGAGATGDDGDVGSNGDVVLKGLVQGNLEAGGNIDPGSSSSGIITGNGTLGGWKQDGLNCGAKSCVMGTLLENVSPAPIPCDCSTFDLASLVTAAAATNDNGSLPAPYTGATNVNLAGGANLTIPAGGTYYFNSVTLVGGATITIGTTDVVNIVLSGTGPYSFGGNGIVNASDNASNLQIYSDFTGDIDFSGGSEFSAVVYAPDANINLNGSFDVYGAFLGNVFVGVGTADIHYDEAAEDLDMVIDVYEITSWREVRL